MTEDAALTRIVVKRGNTTSVVDAYAAVKEGGQISDFALQDGDFVLVPKNENRVLVMEAVGRPGFFPLPERKPLTLLELMGEVHPQPGSKQVILTHQTRAGLQNITIPMEKVRNGAEGNQILQNGDVVYVPAAKGGSGALSKIGSAVRSLGFIRLFLP